MKREDHVSKRLKHGIIVMGQNRGSGIAGGMGAEVMAHSGTLIFMRNVPDKPRNRVLTEPLIYIKYSGGMGLIPVGFEWDGSSAEIILENESEIKRALVWTLAYPLNFCMRSIFPRHWHPIASCRHDWRCHKAMTPEERLFADKEFEKDVGTTSWWITKKMGYMGVRVGAHLGIGVYNY